MSRLERRSGFGNRAPDDFAGGEDLVDETDGFPGDDRSLVEVAAAARGRVEFRLTVELLEQFDLVAEPSPQVLVVQAAAVERRRPDVSSRDVEDDAALSVVAAGLHYASLRDLLANVSVRQERVPTGRFMGGRELQQLCAGADPTLASLDTLQALVQRGLMALPGFEAQGGPFRTRAGQVVDGQGPVALASLAPAERATLAALYCAQVTAWLIDRLSGLAPVLIEPSVVRRN